MYFGYILVLGSVGDQCPESKIYFQEHTHSNNSSIILGRYSTVLFIISICL